MPDILGYARVSTNTQDLGAQLTGTTRNGGNAETETNRPDVTGRENRHLKTQKRRS